MDTATTGKLELPIDGMTCASCAARVERGLNALDGVDARVNYATERAVVEFDPAVVDPSRLVAAVEATGYHARLPRGSEDAPEVGGESPNGSLRALLVRTVAALVLAAPVVAISMVPALQFDGWPLVVLVLATPVVWWCGWTFHRSAWINARHGATTMDTLVSIGTIAAWTWSVVVVVALDGASAASGHPAHGSGGHVPVYFEAAVVVVAFVLAGRYLEHRAKRRARSAIESLLELGASEATVLDPDGGERRVPIDELEVGQQFVVRPGERVATDGVVETGESAIDRSLLTGESVPVEVGPGDEVAGATINTTGRLVVRATRVGRDTALAQVARLVAAAQDGKAPVQRLADRISAVFVPVVLGLSLATLIGWLVLGPSIAAAFEAAVAVLIVACPCALGLATPMALLVGTGRGAQLGVLIKGPEVLESTRRVDTIVLDKTGTVTEGRMVVDHVVATAPHTDADVLRLAAAVEAGSEHPIARAVVHAARDRMLEVPDVIGFTNRAGEGVTGLVDGRFVTVGRATDLDDPQLVTAADSAHESGMTAIAVGWAGEVHGIIAVADQPKPTSPRALEELRSLGLHPVLLTGDDERVARAVATSVGIHDVVAGVLPAGKVDAIRDLQSQGRVVAMVGDGVNDAPALAQADLGMAIGTGTDVAIEASDLTLVSGDLRAAVDAIRLSRRTLATIKGNLFWAFAYNVAALPLAMAGLLDPMVAGAAMACSSVFVVTNSLRLRGFRSIR